ncbi:MAG: type II toxin-antitoxin system VapC family toxin [Kiritimatiellae bacterium]|jgi:predicted nucleic acid-binding protein|nr:type II toxin-antitoxin system VapC family toxin [Kiritimatiellia bacterium]
MTKYLVDTDVLIDFLRGNDKACKFIKTNFESIVLSTITVAELYSGVLEGNERKYLDEFIDLVTVIPVTEKIAIQGGLFKRDYIKSHGTGFADAIIAATTTVLGLTLCSLNRKHFPMIDNLKVPYQK